ncbi:Beta-glucosidase/6-phospho-beta-glucosidase/beta-galactosidase [Geosmithia morbida]|uniref:Beta-glucosidase/6-phospho-beta-glucosidase/beta-galactosidase n=1 Tax=Geosmithia morbida TaxID=1094350 RepID=A0A9P4YQW9_9HYPO|nr:Beta-glucosidase/6-phospho-beta-glucosidase/beta-galactosidase [Geosmithia morbida]KAF4121476.1 Beta-glucosidase/6-phospho-beta-glucosidase/beta-galactosidase [Geosmithia morbida]
MVALRTVVLLVSAVSVVSAQQVYKPVDGPDNRSQCADTQTAKEPTYSFSQFSYTMTTTVRYATSRPSPTATSTYAAPPESLTLLIPEQSYTTWGRWEPGSDATATDTDDPYGQAAWTSLWESADPPGFTDSASSLYSTTVEPTAVPSSELVLPPGGYFGPTDCYTFPAGFEVGVSSSAAQIEGATAQEGKGPSLLDLNVRDGRPKDYVTNEHYYYYKQDIERVAAMGVKHFSFSISWARILPFALPGTPVNQEGIDHYNDVIDYVLGKGMVPVVTLLHFDTPVQFFAGNLTAVGDTPVIGFTNGGYQNETFPDAFVNYAKIVMAHYADRVPTWFTFNEPLLHSFNGVSVDHVLRSHARVSHFYRHELGASGKVSFKLSNSFGVPRDPRSDADVYAANHFNSFYLETFGNPVFRGEDYPESYKSTVHDYVPLSDEDLEYMNGTADFLAIDPYTATVVAPPTPGHVSSIRECAADYGSAYRPTCVSQTTVDVYGWDIGYRSQSYVYVTPTYLRAHLGYLWNTFRAPVMITEFGYPVYAEADKELSDQLYDLPRSYYYLSFMSEVLKAIWEDGVNVIGAYAWSFADNWEFGDYDQHFGIQTVNRTTQERHYKKSFFDFVDFAKTRGAE